MRLLALLVASLLSACAAEPGPGFSDGEPTPTPTPVEPAFWQGWADEPITGLVETSNPGEDPGCVQALEGCAEDYLAFPTRAAEHARPLSEAALEEALLAMRAGVPALLEPQDPAALGAALGEALNIGFLLGGLHARPLEVRTIGQDAGAGFDAFELLFVDGWVGAFRGRLWLPEGGDWLPPILGIHGHATEAVDLFDVYGGAELVAAGHPLLALDLRVNYADDLEDTVQRALLRSGFSLLELRIYEAFLAMKYLRGRGDMEPALGLLAHSGGAAAMNVALRLAPHVDAYAFDNTADYDCWLKNDRLLDDSVPAVHPYRGLINDVSTLEPAILRADYGFPEGPDVLVAFFAEAL